MNGGGVTPRPTPPTPQETLYYTTLQNDGVNSNIICYSDGSLVDVEIDGNHFLLKYQPGNNIVKNEENIWPSYPVRESGVVISWGESYQIGDYSVEYNGSDDEYYLSPSIEHLQQPLYAHEYTFGNFITNGVRDQSNNMKAAYINVGGTVQLFKENATAGKWVTVTNENNLALMDAPLTSFEAGPPSDFTYQGFTFTFEQGDVDGYKIAPALSII